MSVAKNYKMKQIKTGFGRGGKDTASKILPFPMAYILRIKWRIIRLKGSDLL